MGYHSDVGLALRKKDYQAMLDGISDFTPSRNDRIIIKDFILGAATSEVERGGETIVVCQWNGVRWYGDEPGDEYITNFFLDTLDDFELMRVGEALGDVDEWSEHKNTEKWGIFGVSQSLLVNPYI